MNKHYLRYRETNIRTSKRYYLNNSEKVKKDKINRTKMFKNGGRCVNCGKKLLLNESYRCLSCRIKHNAGTKKRRKYLNEKGLCWTCILVQGK